MLEAFIVHCIGLLDKIGDGCVGSLIIFQESSNKHSIEGNEK